MIEAFLLYLAINIFITVTYFYEEYVAVNEKHYSTDLYYDMPDLPLIPMFFLLLFAGFPTIVHTVLSDRA